MQDIILVNPRITGVMAAWLHEHEQNSSKTVAVYRPMVEGYRSLLLSHALDLLPPPALDADALREWRRQIVYHVQAWAALPNVRTGKAVTPATYNLRLAAVASFYDYAIRHDECDGPNLLEAVKRRKQEQYAHSKAMSFEDGEMDAAIDAIPTDTLNGLRDRAMLSLTLYTGRRLAEIASLRCNEVTVTASGVTIEWLHTKGDKSITDELPNHCPATAHLRRWMKRYYGSSPAPDNYVFPALARNNEGGKMTARGIEQRAAKWLPTGGRFHSLRHTFARAMDEAGAPVTDIQRRLGHSNLATTSRYLTKLSEGRNDHMDGLIAVYAGKKGRKKA